MTSIGRRTTVIVAFCAVVHTVIGIAVLRSGWWVAAWLGFCLAWQMFITWAESWESATQENRSVSRIFAHARPASERSRAGACDGSCACAAESESGSIR